MFASQSSQADLFHEPSRSRFTLWRAGQESHYYAGMIVGDAGWSRLTAVDWKEIIEGLAAGLHPMHMPSHSQSHHACVRKDQILIPKRPGPTLAGCRRVIAHGAPAGTGALSRAIKERAATIDRGGCGAARSAHSVIVTFEPKPLDGLGQGAARCDAAAVSAALPGAGGVRGGSGEITGLSLRRQIVDRRQ